MLPCIRIQRASGYLLKNRAIFGALLIFLFSPVLGHFPQVSLFTREVFSLPLPLLLNLPSFVSLPATPPPAPPPGLPQVSSAAALLALACLPAILRKPTKSSFWEARHLLIPSRMAPSEGTAHSGQLDLAFTLQMETRPFATDVATRWRLSTSFLLTFSSCSSRPYIHTAQVDMYIWPRTRGQACVVRLAWLGSA